MTGPVDPSERLPNDEVDAFVGPVEVLALGAADGPLTGTLLAVKDVIDVAGRVTGAGNPDLASAREAASLSAPVVDALVAAGSTVVGKTVTDELAYSLGGDNVHFAAPTNAAALGRTTGGSSSGSAAAVAAGLVDLALGTDTGGSIRVPASYCGIYGWRPTHGAVSTTGVTALSPSFDTVGLLARSPALLRTAATVALSTGPGSSPDLPPGRPPTAGQPLPTRRPRVAVAAELVDAVDRDVADALVSAVGERFGYAPEQIVLGVDMDECLTAFRTLQGAEAWAVHGEWITSARPALGPATEDRFRAASLVTPDQVTQATTVRDRVRASVLRATEDGVVIVAPPAAGGAPVRGGYDTGSERVRSDTLRLSSLAGLAGAPVVVVPGATVIGSDGSSLPLGIALIAAPNADRALLDLAVVTEVPPVP